MSLLDRIRARRQAREEIKALRKCAESWNYRQRRAYAKANGFFAVGRSRFAGITGTPLYCRKRGVSSREVVLAHVKAKTAKPGMWWRMRNILAHRSPADYRADVFRSALKEAV